MNDSESERVLCSVSRLSQYPRAVTGFYTQHLHFMMGIFQSELPKLDTA